MDADADPAIRTGSGLRLTWTDRDDVRVFDLKRGRNTLGRGLDCDIRLEDSTISELHAELDGCPEEVLVRDLGSTNGTFIDGEPVRESILKPGQRLRVGAIELLLTERAAVCPGNVEAAESPISGQTLEVASRAFCAIHPQSRATWFCTECERQLCSGCVKILKLPPDRTVTLCPACQGWCERLDTLTKRARHRSFFLGLVCALAYPMQPAGLLLLACAAAINFALGLGGRLFLFGGFSVLLSVGAGACVLAYLRQILLNSADGQDGFPPWPDMSFESLKEIVLLYLATTVVCFGPWTICRLFLTFGPDGTKLVCHVLLGLGAFYFPMAILAVAMNEDAAALNPLAVVPCILNTFVRYVTLCLFLAVVVGLAFWSAAALHTAEIRHLADAAAGLISLYVALVLTRAIGWFHYCCQDALR